MAGATVLERELNTQDQRTADLREVLYEESVQQAKDIAAGYDMFRTQENSARTSASVPAKAESRQASPSNPTLERIRSYYEMPAAPSRKRELFKGYEYSDGEVMRKSLDSDMMIPVFETVTNVVEEKYFEIPDYTQSEEVMEPEAAVEIRAEEDEDALPTRRTMETVIRPAAAVKEMGIAETRTGLRATLAALSTRTKAVLISIISAIVLAIVLICVNTSIIRSLNSDLTNLKGRAAQERSTYEYLQKESDLYTDPDSEIVKEWAENNGMTK